MKSTVLLCAALGLAGCSGGGPSVSGTASEGSGSNSGLSILWEKARGVSVDNSRTVEMPALGLIAEAFANGAIGNALGVNAGPLLVSHGDNGSIAPVPRQVARYGRIFAEDWKAANAGVAEAAGSADHLALALPILAALQPRQGWEVDAMAPDPAFDTPFFRRHGRASSYDPELHKRYMQMLSTAAMFANDVFGLIARDLQGTNLADPDDASARVLAAYRAIPAPKLRAMLAAAADRVEAGGFTTDLTGSGNIHFIHSDAGDFVGDARGVTWTKAGGVRFGDGRIGGQAINLRLASTASLSRRASQSGTQGTNTDARVEGSGSVGVGR